jgi:ribosomal protein S11
MIQKNNLIKSLFIYGNIKYFSDYKDKLIKHFIKCLLFARKICLVFGNERLLKDKSLKLNIMPQTRLLKAKNFFNKSVIFDHLVGIDIFFITKTGKNVFISWLDVFGRLKLNKSLMTFNDPKKNITKKQKSFSIYFLLKKFGTTLRKRYKLRKVALLLKGSLGIRRKKYFVSGLAHSGLKIKSIIDVTNIPFNGCRLKKKKRL